LLVKDLHTLMLLKKKSGYEQFSIGHTELYTLKLEQLQGASIRDIATSLKYNLQRRLRDTNLKNRHSMKTKPLKLEILEEAFVTDWEQI